MFFVAVLISGGHENLVTVKHDPVLIHSETFPIISSKKALPSSKKVRVVPEEAPMPAVRHEDSSVQPLTPLGGFPTRDKVP